MMSKKMVKITCLVVVAAMSVGIIVGAIGMAAGIFM